MLPSFDWETLWRNPLKKWLLKHHSSILSELVDDWIFRRLGPGCSDGGEPLVLPLDIDSMAISSEGTSKALLADSTASLWELFGDSSGLLITRTSLKDFNLWKSSSKSSSESSKISNGDSSSRAQSLLLSWIRADLDPCSTWKLFIDAITTLCYTLALYFKLDHNVCPQFLRKNMLEMHLSEDWYYPRMALQPHVHRSCKTMSIRIAVFLVASQDEYSGHNILQWHPDNHNSWFSYGNIMCAFNDCTFTCP